MGAQRGRDMLLKIGDGAAPEVFTTVAGLRARTISLNAKTADVTDADSAGRWRELLAGAGMKSASVSGQGVFRDASSDARAAVVRINGRGGATDRGRDSGLGI